MSEHDLGLNEYDEVACSCGWNGGRVVPEMIPVLISAHRQQVGLEDRGPLNRRIWLLDGPDDFSLPSLRPQV